MAFTHFYELDRQKNFFCIDQIARNEFVPACERIRRALEEPAAEVVSSLPSDGDSLAWTSFVDCGLGSDGDSSADDVTTSARKLDECPGSKNRTREIELKPVFSAL